MLPTKPTVTMTSLELVDFINSTRKDGESVLRHDNFMAKVLKVLGEAALKFQDSYTGKDNTSRTCYRFPKREACLMAMSYSYELQAKVFDRMTELEEEHQKPKLTGVQPTKVKKVYGSQWYDCPPRSIEEDFRKVEMLAQFADLSQADKLTALAMTVVQHDEYFASVILAVKHRVKELDGIKLQRPITTKPATCGLFSHLLKPPSVGRDKNATVVVKLHVGGPREGFF